MTKTGKLANHLAIALAALTASGSTFAAGGRGIIIREENSGRLLLLMDKNRNGLVSKQEFLQFMSKEFDRLDVDHSGELSLRELSRIRLRMHPNHR